MRASSWPDMSPLASRMMRPMEKKEVRTTAAEPEGHTAESLTDCHHDRPGDTTMLEALSLRVYFSGELLETLKAGSQTEQVGTVGER